jgi:hypothetical protein
MRLEPPEMSIIRAKIQPTMARRLVGLAKKKTPKRIMRIPLINVKLFICYLLLIFLNTTT